MLEKSEGARERSAFTSLFVALKVLAHDFVGW